MPSASKLAAVVAATGLATLLTVMAASARADSPIEYITNNATSTDSLTAIQWSFGKDKLVKTRLSVADVEKMQETLKEQTRQIEELKRSNGSSSSSSSNELAQLKRTVSDQEGDLKNLSKQVDELKRSSGSSSSSSSSELSNLKREVSEQDRTIDQLKRTVEELSRKVK
ncbi:hypothetical protein RG836_01880 [Pseudomonas sp. SZMC_28357]|uniref:hypothetical protein n=1 Tax=Pseudomonas sp. SZMC_28357 TaxID=3074380 RepID=UPI002872154C|nr:hypothetical protein [Pseudomonas sp. SZMC_28357]MDR9750185.1 hypothetical protein [Pseudomonas sp. SZMC_28357]